MYVRFVVKPTLTEKVATAKNKSNTMLNRIIVKMWVESEIRDIKRKLDMGTLLPAVGNGQIRILKKFYEEFNLEEVSVEDVQYHTEL